MTTKDLINDNRSKEVDQSLEMEQEYGIVLFRTDRIGAKIETETTVMQFGFKTRIEASQVRDKALKYLDRNHEMLYTFEYDPDFSDSLEIGYPLPVFATLHE